MLYPKNQEPFDSALFKNPTSEYRGAPFWAWNTKLEPETVLEQIAQFREMGMGGFHIHPRVGLDTEYLGAEYLELVHRCTERAEQEGLLCWLYDEDRWPSGYGGGFVTENPEFRSHYLVFTPFRQGTHPPAPPSLDSSATSVPNGHGTFLTAFQVELSKTGTLNGYHPCKEDVESAPNCMVWYAYLETAADSPWFNNQSYVDALNPKAIRRFLEVTHEKYAAVVGDAFGKTIPAIFTDEPQFPHKQFLGYAHSQNEIVLPYTGDLEQTFRVQYGESLLEHLPELVWELPAGQVSAVRYHYHDHLAERFAQAYADQVGAWCKAHGILLTGHMMEEPTLYSQTRALGDAMRSLRSFDLPGIDMLCDAREYTTAKQAQSVSHQYARCGVTSELYGVTNWDFDFRKHKLQGDWQAALGVTTRVHHLTWMSMGGEAKRDYPASIGFQSPWYREYRLLEDHFARINTAMTRGRPIVKIGVVHPVESYWLHYGPNQQTGSIREELEANFKNVTEWLLFALLDFDFIAESLLPAIADGAKVGAMEYDAILVPGCETIRSSTLCFLEKFAAAGKQVIFAGGAPTLLDAVPSEKPARFARGCTQIPLAQSAILTALDPYRLIDIRYDGPKHLKKPRHKKNWDGERTPDLLCQLRNDKDEQWLFIAHGKEMRNPDDTAADQLLITLKGDWLVTLYGTLDGQCTSVSAVHSDGNTILRATLYGQDSLLFKLSAQSVPKDAQITASYTMQEHPFPSSANLSLSEPNVLLLDMARFRFDGGEWNPQRELLQIDNQFRAELGFPQRKAALAQPWTNHLQENAAHTLQLEFSIHSEMLVENTRLALENLAGTAICLNAQPVSNAQDGWFVDPCIQTCKLPPIPAGDSVLTLTIPFTRKSNVEWGYLLGSFGVRVQGDRAVIIPLNNTVRYSSLTGQGMPFYGGNAVYSCSLQLDQGEYELEISKFRAPLLSIALDGVSIGKIALSPYNVRFQVIQSGLHHLEITSFGNRINCFGTVHDCDETEVYFDPNAWRTEGCDWSDEYQLRRTGILKAPVLRRILG